jgi:fatty-acyl-CoA synthase
MNIPLTPIRCLARAVDLFGNRTGVVCGDKTFTYADLGSRARRLAGALQSFGIASGDRVAYLSFNTHKLLEGYYGVILAGGIVMPLNVRLSPQELIGILNHSGARLLFYEPEFEPLVGPLREHVKGIEKFVGLTDEAYEEFIRGAEEPEIEFMGVDENSIAELFYTSGSTGVPKGVALSHRNLYLHAIDLVATFRSPATAVDLHTIPLFHANGWGRPQVSTLLGIRQVMVRRFDPAAVCALVGKVRATHMSLVPTMLNAILNVPDLDGFDFSSLERVMIGGAASSPELMQRAEKALGCEVVAGYGLTETCPVLTVSEAKPGIEYRDEADRYRRQAMAGWPVLGVEVHVVDPDGKPVPRDMQTIGEVVARGDHVMSGYFREEEATRAVSRDGWFHTGDMAVWDEENYIHIVDRKKEIIISGGENISSIEVEKAIFSHPDVFECAVVAAPDEKWGEVPAAIIVRKPGSTLTAEAMLDYLGGRLGRFKLPRIIEFSEEQLPKTGTGKIRKLVLKDRFWAGKEKRVQG